MSSVSSGGQISWDFGKWGEGHEFYYEDDEKPLEDFE